MGPSAPQGDRAGDRRPERPERPDPRGVPGASARREHLRRTTKREQQIRTAHPHLGGVILALSGEPASTHAWASGAWGEEVVGRVLNGLAGQGVIALHDRRMPRSRANIDHIVIAPSGVYVIDTKRYRNQRLQRRVDGGVLGTRVEKLIVGGRDKTTLVDGVITQAARVQRVVRGVGLGHVPMRAMLCFVDARWPLAGRAFTVQGIDVVWPQRAAEMLTMPGWVDEGTRQRLSTVLASAFPPA